MFIKLSGNKEVSVGVGLFNRNSHTARLRLNKHLNPPSHSRDESSSEDRRSLSDHRYSARRNPRQTLRSERRSHSQNSDVSNRFHANAEDTRVESSDQN